MAPVYLETLSEFDLADSLVFDRALDHVARFEKHQHQVKINRGVSYQDCCVVGAVIITNYR